MFRLRHVPWENCPYSSRGQHVGKEGVPTLVVNASFDYYLFSWHHDFGHAGALNNLNIWERINLYQSFIDGSMAEMYFEFEINGEKFTFVDRMYPPLSQFVKTVSVQLTNMERRFAK